MRAKNVSLVLFLILVCVAIASAQAIESVYTDYKKCKTLEKDDSAAYFQLSQCPGVGGYKLLVASGDSRESMEVVTPNGKKYDLYLGEIGGGAFSGLGQRNEWRVKRQSGKLVPIAMITRFNVAKGPDYQTDNSYLVVTKITPQQVCRVGEIDPGPNQNEKARQMADNSASMPCYKSINEQNEQ